MRKRSKEIKVRLSNQEECVVNENMKAVEQTNREAFYRWVSTKGQAPYPDLEYRKNFGQLLWEVNKIGVNINQIAHIANEEMFITQQQFDISQNLLRDIHKLIYDYIMRTDIIKDREMLDQADAIFKKEKRKKKKSEKENATVPPFCVGKDQINVYEGIYLIKTPFDDYMIYVDPEETTDLDAESMQIQLVNDHHYQLSSLDGSVQEEITADDAYHYFVRK
jgi:hypothetical protein